MPIRFRCAYCEQLMGIARRKAGTVVRCPKCAGEIIVPMPDAGSPPDPDDPDDQIGSDRIEDADFERKLQDIDAKTAKELPTAPGTPRKPAVPVPKPAPPPRGIFLSTSMLILSVSVTIILLVLVFVLGVVIGRNSGGP